MSLVLQAAPSRVVVVDDTNDDWVAIYVDGQKRAEGPFLSAANILEAVGIDYEEKQVSIGQHDYRNLFPDTLEELERAAP